MSINNLSAIYENERKQKPKSINHLLDFYQMKYVQEEISIQEYKSAYHCLHENGAKSAFEPCDKVKHHAERDFLSSPD